MGPKGLVFEGFGADDDVATGVNCDVIDVINVMDRRETLKVWETFWGEAEGKLERGSRARTRRDGRDR
jgi:hypothetical protein